jgi:hypothetical protein
VKVFLIVMACILAYIIIAFLNYGYVKARRGGDFPESAICGGGWPLYWVGRGFSACADAAESVWTDPPPPKLEK